MEFYSLKTTISTKKTVQLIDEDTDLGYNNYLRHGNDIAVVGLDGSNYLYIVDRGSGDPVVNKIKMTGAKTYKRVGTYTTKLNGSNISMSSISRRRTPDSSVDLLFRKDSTFYVGSIGADAKSGNINVTEVFKIDRKSAVVNGKNAPELDEYCMQGIEYRDTKLYVTMDGRKDYVPNASAILVYDNVFSTANKGKTIKPSETAFRVIAKSYLRYEIEGCSISNGMMCFSVNKDHSDGTRT